MVSLKDFLRNSANAKLSNAQRIVRLNYGGNTRKGYIILCKSYLAPLKGIVISFYDGVPFVPDCYGEEELATIINFCNGVDREQVQRNIDIEMNKVLNEGAFGTRLEELLMLCYLMITYLKAKTNE